MRVLLVDDDMIALRVCRALLTEQGCEVTTAADGREALARLAAEHFPLVITDWMMPNVDGLELVTRLRAAESMAYTYVIMLTARGSAGDHADANRALTGGVDDFLSKPVQRDDLIARLHVARRIIGLQAQLLERHQALSAANQRMRADLGAAAQVQRALLPTALPVSPHWNVAWRAAPCEELGGDTLNCFAVDEHHLAGYLLDVSGHGVPSALLAVQASRLLQPVLGQGSMLKERLEAPPRYRLVDPERLMNSLADKFPPQAETAQYFTIGYWLAEHATGTVRLGAGGQPTPLYLRADGVSWIDISSSAIGMLPREQCEFAGRRVTMATGERLLLYSDGITEAGGQGDELYGVERLAAIAMQSRALPLDAWLAAILADVAAFTGGRPPDDDLSLLALERR